MVGSIIVFQEAFKSKQFLPEKCIGNFALKSNYLTVDMAEKTEGIACDKLCTLLRMVEKTEGIACDKFCGQV